MERVETDRFSVSTFGRDSAREICGTLECYATIAVDKENYVTGSINITKLGNGTYAVNTYYDGNEIYGPSNTTKVFPINSSSVGLTTILTVSSTRVSSTP